MSKESIQLAATSQESLDLSESSQLSKESLELSESSQLSESLELSESLDLFESPHLSSKSLKQSESLPESLQLPNESLQLSKESLQLSESSQLSNESLDLSELPESPSQHTRDSVNLVHSPQHTRNLGNSPHSSPQDCRKSSPKTRELPKSGESSNICRKSPQESTESLQGGRESSLESTEGVKSGDSPGGVVSSEPSSWPASPSSGYHSGRRSSGDTGVSTLAQGKGKGEDCWGEGEGEAWWGRDVEGEDWCEGEWPADRALPLPRWGCARPDLTFTTLEEFSTFLACLTPHLQHSLSHHCYDTLSNFITFCESYICWRDGVGGGAGLDQFYRDYDPPLLPGRHTCVGLTCLLQSHLSALEPWYPGIKDATYKVSCEEEVEHVDWYCESEVPPYTCEKEHVLVCVRVRVAGQSGVVLLDPGYHVGVPVVVMDNGAPPQSGTVPGSSARPGLTRTFHYLSWPDNPGYVAWNVTNQPKDGPATHHVSLIHVARPFLSHVDVAERRNLAYPFKTLVARDQDGALTYGLYFPLRHPDHTHVTLFAPNTRRKVLLSYFLGMGGGDSGVETVLAEVGAGTGRGGTPLRDSLTTVATLLADHSLLDQLETLNHNIDLISKEN